MNLVTIVNEDDEVIGAKARDALQHPQDIYRVAVLWLTNSQGDVLIAQRGLTKTNSPGLWGPAVAGTIDEGESYDQNIVKEIQEEIGLTVTIDQLTKGPYQKPDLTDTNRRYFRQWYFLVRDLPIGDFIIPRDEVEAIRWVAPATLKQELKYHPERFLPTFSRYVNDFCS